MAHYYLAMCLFLQSGVLRQGAGADGDSGVGWPEKSSYTVHFTPALISMSTVKAPPMSRLGVDRRRDEGGQSQLRPCYQTVTKIWP